MNADALPSLVQSLVPVFLLRSEMNVMNLVMMLVALTVAPKLVEYVKERVWRTKQASTFIYKRDVDTYTAIMHWVDLHVAAQDVRDTLSMSSGYVRRHDDSPAMAMYAGGMRMFVEESKSSIVRQWNGSLGKLLAFTYKGNTMSLEKQEDKYTDKESRQLYQHAGVTLYSDDAQVLNDFVSSCVMTYDEWKRTCTEDTNVVYTIVANTSSSSKNGMSVAAEGETAHLSLPQTMHSTKTFDNVFLDDLTLQRIRGPLEEFMSTDAIERYRRMGLPRKIGFMFFGPPGTGKTSLAYAICRHVNKALVIVRSTDIEALIHLAPTLKNKVILLDDVDCFQNIERTNKTQVESVTENSTKEVVDTFIKKNEHFSNLLAALDGYNTFHECVIIMTTNARESIDSTLIRPGRIDHHVEIAATTASAIRKLFHTAFVDYPHLLDAIPDSALRTDVDMATLSNCVVRAHLDDPQKAVNLVTTANNGDDD